MIITVDHKNIGNVFPTAIIKHERNDCMFYFYTEHDVIMNVSVLDDHIIRFRYTIKGYFNDDFSYAVDIKKKHNCKELQFAEHPTFFEIKTSKVRCTINKEDCKICIYDANNHKILEDERGFHWEEVYEYGGYAVKMTKLINNGEVFYGMGDKATHTCLNGNRFENWVTDQYAFHKEQDPLYKDIPFYIGLHDSKAYGIFFDNTFRSFFDFGSERKNVVSFWANGGEMNYYFIYGPMIKEVIASYTNLTGKPDLPPLWALGYQQSKWSYSTEEVFRGIAKEFRKLAIPCDALHLDIDYMDGFRCFTWNKENFPHPKKMVADLLKDGFKTVCIIDCGIKIDKEYEIYQQGLKDDLFCKRADGPLMEGRVWPGNCVFPEFTHPKVREWWKELHRELIGDIGVRGIWCDMNEPAVMEVPTKTFPIDVRHDFDGHPCSHNKAHNIYGMQMAKAAHEGVKKYISPKRPFTITRSAYAGTQKYASTWTGDSVASWEHLWLANVQIQRLALCGYSFSGSDVGGFAEHPSPELYIRWVQLACFHPFFRTHSSGHHGNQEPWSFGQEATTIVKKFIELRYQLLPYMYTAFWHYIADALPILSPIVVFDQEDVQTLFRTDEFIFGKHILACPVIEPNVSGRRMYLPKGNWYNYWTNEIIAGKNEYWVEAKLDSMPIFILEGAIIPLYPVQQYTDEKKLDEITLNVYYKHGEETSTLYEDEHDGYKYLDEHYVMSKFDLTGKAKELLITQEQKGNYKTPYRHFVLNLIGLPFEISKIELDGKEISLKEVAKGMSVRIPQNFSKVHILSKDTH